MKKLKKLTSVFLAVIMTLGVMTVAPFTVSAASCIKTQSEAVAWLKAQDGASYDFGNFTDPNKNYWGGTQCVEFVKAYVNWLMTGDAWHDVWNRPTLDGNTIWQNSLWNELGWTVYYNTADFMPQPGDIFSTGGCHTGVVISSDLNTAVVADSNARNNNPYDGDPVWVHTINWRSASSGKVYGATHFIRPNFATVNNGYNPEGYLDSVKSNSPGTITVKGWTVDRDDVNSQLVVHIYVGGPAGSGAPGYAITANKYRHDVNSVFPGVGDYHGFEETISVSKTGNQPIYAYALNIGGGNINTLLEQSPLTVNIMNNNTTAKPTPTSIKIQPTTISLGAGEACTLTKSVSPSNASTSYTWSSSNTSVATVSNGKVTAKKSGTAYITVKTSNGKTAQCKVIVKPAPTSVKSYPASVTLGKGETYTISESTNSGSYANAANLKWSTSNSNVATVTKGSANKATIKAKGVGTAYIKITLYNGKTATCKVTVKNAPSSVSLSKTSLTLSKGATYTISESTNSGSYANAANLKWTSSNSSVATVTKSSANKAKITAKSKGTAYIKITLYNGKTAQCKVTVK